MTSMTAISFAKGHGTENDFVILQDEQASLELTPGLVRGMCDRRSGIGADGVLRVARAGALVHAGVIDSLGDSDPDTWFMDYRNADGTVAEMCGNGVRVFAHWLCSRGLVQQTEFPVATRAGLRYVKVHDCTQTHADVTVDMGLPVIGGVSDVLLSGQRLYGVCVDMGNPHLACIVDGLDAQALAQLPVGQPMVTDPEAFPNGVNVEIATPLDDDDHMIMRVRERGAGETRACGTGTVAAAQAGLIHDGRSTGEVTVSEPGGTLRVTITETSSTLTGPSVIFAAGMVTVSALTRR